MTVYRHFNGIGIEGKRFDLRVYPEKDDTFILRVIAAPAATGFDGYCSMEDSEAATVYFARDDIKLNGFELSCLAVGLKQLPEYRHGFTLILEGGMPELLKTWLPILDKARDLSKRVIDAYQTFTGQVEGSFYSGLIREVIAAHVFQLTPDLRYEDAVNIIIDPARVSDKEEMLQLRAFMLSKNTKAIVAGKLE